ncbi:glycosyl hydrolase [Schizophyllum amplum]|uniref:Arabinan endo-1,5-alpha-L-arabinosidase n=1 Tax=Schizophyllum amplum TaxID=97359 RepID=A0A550CSY4_9AGAR|nr:glycosyl hydrolase [Auriculariopsis ampla]
MTILAALTGDIYVRDPAIAYNQDLGKYSIFSTREGVKIFTADELSGPWIRTGSVMPNCSKIELEGNCNCWAPDVAYLDGQWVMYYAVSSVGSQNSAVGVATSPSLQEGTWTEHGMIFNSSEDAELNWNAIDANIIEVNGNLIMSFGSYWGGMFQMPMSDIYTLNTLRLPGNHVAGGNDRPAEGGFVYKPQSSDWYYLFFSDGSTGNVDPTEMPEPLEEYKVLVGRAENATGPFVDKLGRALTKDLRYPTGSVVLASHDNVFAPGGQSLFLDPISGRDVMVYHYVPVDNITSDAVLGINYIDFTHGWPEVVHA